jgi:cation/acetate symporter
MQYEKSSLAIAIFSAFVGFVLILSFYLGKKAQSARGYYAAHGQVGWFINGIAFAGDYLSAASFLGICGMIAFFGYDGFLYSIGYLAGWIVALFVIAEPIKRLGRYTFADALDAQFHSRGIKLTAAISTLVVSIFYLIPQMVGAGALIKPLLGLEHYWGVIIVGAAVIVIVVTAGMVSTTWVQFIKGSLLVFFCFVLTILILQRGLNASAGAAAEAAPHELTLEASRVKTPWPSKPYIRVTNSFGSTTLYRTLAPAGDAPARTIVKALQAASTRPTTAVTVVMYTVVPTQVRTTLPNDQRLVNGKPQSPINDLRPVGAVASLPGKAQSTGPLGPASFISTLQDSTIITWSKDEVKEADGTRHEIFYPVSRPGKDLLTPGGYFKDIKSNQWKGKLNFLSLMLALFCGTAALPHILIRYYTVKDAASARKSTIVGIASIGFFYVLTLYLGLGAMTSGQLDPTDNNMSAPLLARSFNPVLFAIISAIAFTTVLGTVSGLIIAASGAVAHDLMSSFLKIEMDDHAKVTAGKIACVVVGLIAIGLGIVFKDFNVTFLVGWAFNIAASANLPSLVMLLFWRGTTKQGITASITVGLLSSLAWILLSSDAYTNLYRTTLPAPMPFNQPGIITIPLGFIVLIVVSLLTRGTGRRRHGFEVATGGAASR